jgi:sigma-B regulation protein RsbU (phosphoserine phosphatase)
LAGTGVALGLFEHAEYTAAETRLDPGDLLVFYSDGITEAEDPSGQPLEEHGLELVLERHAAKTPSEIAAEVLSAVESHARRARFADDLTILAVKRNA